MKIDIFSEEKDRLEKDRREKAGIPEEPVDTLTVKEILSGKESSALFGEMIEQSGDPDDKEMLARLVSGKMEADDVKKIAEARDAFSEKMREAEAIKSELTPELVQQIAKNNPDIQRIMQEVGADGIVKISHETIKKIAVSDPSRFREISLSVKVLQNSRNGQFKELNDKVEDLCKKQGINPEKYLKAAAISDDVERKKAINKLAVENAGFWKALTSGKRIRQLVEMKTDLEAAFAELDHWKREIGSVLALSIKGNQDMLEALNREMAGEPKKKEVFGMNDIKKEVVDEATIKADFKKWRSNATNNLDDAIWNQLTDQEKGLHRDEFMRERANERKGAIAAKGGFWASIFSALFDTMFAGFDKSTLN